MSDSDGGGCCRCCCSFILTSGLTALFLWLSLRTSNPKCSIQNFYVPALNKTLNSTTNHTIFFDLKLDNTNKDKGVHYDAVNLTFYYGPNVSFLIGNYTVHGFYQGHGKNTHRKYLLDTRGVPWDEALKAVSNGSLAVFRVDLVTAVRFRIIGFKTKRHKLDLKANVEVDGTGDKLKKKKGIRLKSGAPELDCYHARVVLSVILSAFVLLL
ncbi:unnamed protein product [Ilex paraguariensis]|uniref:Protein NDR1-like n=1 Tax=Ilex paraguariensis TaxID=185542 RepID=A0ABC8S3C4_9AQUA